MPKATKTLYKALVAQDIPTIERIGTENDSLSFAAASVLGILKLTRGDAEGARDPLEFVFASGKELADDPFITKHTAMRFELPVAEGITASLTLDRAAIGLALAEVYQSEDRFNDAVRVVEQLEPTTYAALSLAELYCEVGDYTEVVQVTEGVTNEDDATAMLCVFRGIAFREQRMFEAARQSFKEALRTKKRDPVVRHRALLERARAYEADGNERWPARTSNGSWPRTPITKA